MQLCPSPANVMGIYGYSQKLPAQPVAPGAEQRAWGAALPGSVCPRGSLSPSPLCRRNNLPKSDVFQVIAGFLSTAVCKGGSKTGQEFPDFPFPSCQMSTPIVGMPELRHCQKTANPEQIHSTSQGLLWPQPLEEKYFCFSI